MSPPRDAAPQHPWPGADFWGRWRVCLHGRPPGPRQALKQETMFLLHQGPPKRLHQVQAGTAGLVHPGLWGKLFSAQESSFSPGNIHQSPVGKSCTLILMRLDRFENRSHKIKNHTKVAEWDRGVFQSPTRPPPTRHLGGEHN